MTYLKFTRAGPVSPFTDHPWVPGEWTSDTEARLCRSGFHACRVPDLPLWLNEELWRIELAEPIMRGRHKVVAARGRLVSKVEEWTPELAGELAMACAARAVGHAVAELAVSDLPSQADRLARAVAEEAPEAWVPVAVACGQDAAAAGGRPAAKLCGYVVDAVEAIDFYPVASVAYIASRAANQRSSPDVEDPYAAERAWQADWLAERLNLVER
jgi:hypothetical protein